MPSWGDFAPELICLGVDLTICLILRKAYNATDDLIKDLKTAPHIDIDEHLVSRICNHPEGSSPQDGVRSLPYAVVRGEVTPLGRTLSPIYGEAKGLESGVIQKVVFTEHKRNMSRTGLWVDSQRVIHQFSNDVPFSLTNSQVEQLQYYFLMSWNPFIQDSVFSLSRPHIDVIDWKDASRIDLETVYDHFEPANGGIGSHLWGWILGDVLKGTQKTESMLTKGTSLTGVGELVSGPDGVRLQPPSDGRQYYLVKNSLSSLVKEVESGKTVLKVFLCLLTGLGVGVASWAAWKLVRKLREEKAARANLERLENIVEEREARRVETGARVTREEESVPEALQCVVCLGAEREVILLDCGHVCVCATCAQQLLRANHACPVCRAPIRMVMPAFVS